jgi:hypothetical protein
MGFDRLTPAGWGGAGPELVEGAGPEPVEGGA